MKTLYILIFIFIFLSSPGSSEEQKRSAAKTFNEIFLYRDPETWKNESFIFHEKPASLRSFHYSNIIKIGISTNNALNTHPSYKECAGKKVTVSEIIPENDEFVVILSSKNDNTAYKTTTRGGSIDGLIPLKDIENAKKYFLNKNLWYLQPSLINYNTKEQAYYPVYAERYSPIEVIDVKPGWNTKTPVRLVLETPHQEEGFVDINLNGTNIPETIRNKNRFNKFFSSENPKKWSAQIKAMIENNLIKKGMTSEQVRMSWGSSSAIFKDKNTSREKWLYPYGDILIFKNGILVNITKK